MLVALICTDNPGTGAIRDSARPPHVAWLQGLGKRLKFAGPFMTPDGKTPCGSLIVLDVPTYADAEALAAEDPYRKAGLFQTVDIRAWAWLRNNPEVPESMMTS